MDNAFDIQRYLKEGWDLFIGNAASLVVASIIFLIVLFVANFIPLASLLVSGPMAGGMYYVILDARAGRPFAPMRIFDGFRLKLVPLVLVGILTSVFTLAGALLLILPGLLVMGWYLFSYLFVVEDDRDFWPAMEASREIGFKNHVNVFVMALLIVAMNFLGVLLIGVGLLVSLPLSMCVVLAAYEGLTGKSLSAAAPSPAPPPAPPSPPASGAASASEPPPPPAAG